MKTPLTIEETRQLDKRATDEFGIPSIILMENAGRGLADRIAVFMERSPKNVPVLVLCGTGNNGGDGFVAARHLAHRRFPVTVYLAGDASDLKGDAAVNYRIINAIGVHIRPISEFEHRLSELKGQTVLMVDALLGTGFKGPLRDPIRGIVHRINEFKKYHNARVLVVAADVPSGLNGDTGLEPGAEAMHADLTVTFACLKRGLVLPESKPFTGRIEVVDIGIPEKLMTCFSH